MILWIAAMAAAIALGLVGAMWAWAGDYAVSGSDTREVTSDRKKFVDSANATLRALPEGVVHPADGDDPSKTKKIEGLPPDTPIDVIRGTRELRSLAAQHVNASNIATIGGAKTPGIPLPDAFHRALSGRRE